MRTLTKTLLTTSFLALGTTAVAQDATVTNGDQLSPNATIAENAMKVQNFSTLLAAVDAAGLTGALMGPGPFTVFAPTDEAFARLPAGTVEDLLLPENLSQLESILKAHVVPGVITAADLQTAFLGSENEDDAILMMDGDLLTAESLTADGDVYFDQIGSSIYLSSGDDTVNEAKIIVADIASSNGVIHVIDGVLMPNMQ